MIEPEKFCGLPHITALGETAEEVLAIAKKAARKIRFGNPIIPDRTFPNPGRSPSVKREIGLDAARLEV